MNSDAPMRTPLLSVGAARAQLLALAQPLGHETVALWQAGGRVLAADIVAQRTQPPFSASAMDGYAAAHADLATGSPLRLVGEVAAGHPLAGAVHGGEAVRIFTGGALPEGTDTVLIQEDASVEGGRVSARELPPPAVHVRPRGMDFATGDRLLSAGRVLDPQAVALCASAGHATVPVHRKPRVGILATGDELRLPGEPLAPGQIVASNSYGLAALVQAHGAEAIDLGIAADTMQSLADRIGACKAAHCDVLVTLGGASVGDHDLVHRALTDAGMAPAFWKIAMRPGKPLMTGMMGDTVVLGLPGNPVSAMVCATVFLLPLLSVMVGQSPDQSRRTATLAHSLGANGPRAHYMRAILKADGMVDVFDNQDSSVLSILANANCLVVRPAHDGPRAQGDTVEILALPGHTAGQNG